MELPSLEATVALLPNLTGISLLRTNPDTNAATVDFHLLEVAQSDPHKWPQTSGLNPAGQSGRQLQAAVQLVVAAMISPSGPLVALEGSVLRIVCDSKITVQYTV